MFLRVVAGLAILILGFAGSGRAEAEECVKTVRWADAPPYSSLGADGEIHGSEADLLREALRRMGCRPKFVDLPWGRALDDLRRGRLDILPGAYRNEEREAFALFSQPVNRTRNIVFIKKSASAGRKLESLEDLQATDLRLGFMDRSDYGEAWTRLTQDPAFHARLFPVTNPPSVWHMMKAGRLEAAIEDEVTGLTELAAQGMAEEIAPSGIVVSDRPDHIAFSKIATKPEFVARFDKVLAEMKQDGSFLAVLQRNRPCKVSLAALGCG